MALTMVLNITALNPDKKKKGSTGIIAPTANNKNEVTAASIAEPLRSSVFMPNSSLTNISCALLLSLMISEVISQA